MPRTNFSVNDAKTYKLALDLARDEFSCHVDNERVTRRDLENYLRDTIKNDILKGATLYQAFRRNNIVIFEIIEEITNVVIGEDVLNSPFIDAFVEIKRRDLGDTTAWYSEGGLLTVTTFAGNHWDTDRQALDLGSEFTLPSEWAFIHAYEELERFLLGITTLDKLTDKIYKSINKFIKERLHSQFNSVANAIPSAFSFTGNDEDAIGNACDIIQAAGGYDSLTIAGTPGALRKLARAIPDKMFADSQKEAKANTGSIGMWENKRLITIPQVLKPGTYQPALNNSQLFILGGETKPIKLEYYGDTRSDSDFTGKRNQDQTVDLQLQTKLGMGLVLPNAFGMFTWQ